MIEEAKYLQEEIRLQRQLLEQHSRIEKLRRLNTFLIQVCERLGELAAPEHEGEANLLQAQFGERAEAIIEDVFGKPPDDG